MSSPASIQDHPIHPMLVTLPIGLWVFALLCDIVFAAGGTASWNTVAFYCVAAGLAGAVLAAVPGLVDYFSIHEAEMKRIASNHLLINVSAVVLFAINLWSRLGLPDTSRVPLVLSIIGVVAVGIGGWLGGKMVYVKGMAVRPVDELSSRLAAKERQEKQPRRAA
jgi:uncharacterized membrane protein